MIEQLSVVLGFAVVAGVLFVIVIGCIGIILYNIVMVIISCVMISRTKPKLLKILADRYIHSISERD